MGILDKFILLFEAHVKQTGFTKLNKNLQSATKQMKATKVQAQSLFGGRGMFSGKDMLRGFIGFDIYTALRDLPQQFVDASVRLGAMRSRFNAVADSAQESGEQLKWVSDQSRRLGLDLYNTADNYSIFYATVKKTLGGDVAQDIFGQWTEAFRVLHIPQEQQSRVLYALREMSSKGKIYMQDLAMQLGSAVPSAMPIASQAMGYGNDIQKFREDITKGKINANEFLKTFSKAIHTAYVSGDALAKAMQSPDAQIQRMQANWQYLMLQFAEAGVSNALVSGLQKVNNLLDFAGDHAKELYKILKQIGKWAIGIGIILGGNKIVNKLLIPIIKFLVTILFKGGLVIKTIRSANNNLVRTMALVVGIKHATKGLYALIGGPAGLIMILWTLYDVVDTVFPQATGWVKDLTRYLKETLSIILKVIAGLETLDLSKKSSLSTETKATIMSANVAPMDKILFSLLDKLPASWQGVKDIDRAIRIDSMPIYVQNGGDPQVVSKAVQDGLRKAITGGVANSSSQYTAMPLSNALRR